MHSKSFLRECLYKKGGFAQIETAIVFLQEDWHEAARQHIQYSHYVERNIIQTIEKFMDPTISARYDITLFEKSTRVRFGPYITTLANATREFLGDAKNHFFGMSEESCFHNNINFETFLRKITLTYGGIVVRIQTDSQETKKFTEIGKVETLVEGNPENFEKELDYFLYFFYIHTQAMNNRTKDKVLTPTEMNLSLPPQDHIVWEMKFKDKLDVHLGKK